MRPHPSRAAAVVATVVLTALAGCSSGTDSEPTAPATTTTTTAPETTHTPAPGAVEVSPGGVTTAIGSPAESTEEEYFQACRAAKVWMDQRGGDPKTLIEPYLGELQSTDAAGPGTFGMPWSQLSQARQAAVIVAVQAAAGALCE